ncbi:MAG: hypothetical protein ACREFA_09140, partial [Stellaceae bacterium]
MMFRDASIPGENQGGIFAPQFPRARPAIAAAEVSPAINALSINVPETPNTSLAPRASLMLAVSRSFSRR